MVCVCYQYELQALLPIQAGLLLPQPAPSRLPQYRFGKTKSSRQLAQDHFVSDSSQYESLALVRYYEKAHNISPRCFSESIISFLAAKTTGSSGVLSSFEEQEKVKRNAATNDIFVVNRMRFFIIYSFKIIGTCSIKCTNNMHRTVH